MTPTDSAGGRRTLVVPALACAGALFLASLSPTLSLWGLNPSAFLQPAARAAVWALLLAAAVLALLGPRRGGKLEPAHSQRPPARAGPEARAGAGHGRAALAVALPGLLIPFWLLRDRAHLLGDGLIYLDNTIRGARPLYSEPLAARAWYGYAGLLKYLGLLPSEASLATLTIACGGLAAALCWGIACSLSPRRGERALAWGLLFFSGIAQFWFGYVESYPIAAVAMLLYLHLLLRSARAKAPPILAGAALAVAFSTHLAAAFLVPSYLLLLARARLPRPALALALAAPPILAALLLVGAGFRLASVLEPLRLVRGAAGLHGASGLARFPGILGHRLPDLLNLMLLLFPAPLALWAAGAAPHVASGGVPRPRAAAEADAAPGLLSSAAIPGALLLLALCLAVSPTQDWDLMALTLVPLGALLAALGARRLAGAPPRLRAAWISLALAPALAPVLVNADPAAAARRYGVLLSPSVLLSPHERAYGNEKLARFYRDRGDIERELRYDRAALAAEPGNARYWGAAGLALYRLGRLEEAIPLMREACRMDPGNTEGLFFYGSLLLDAGRYEEAVEVLRRVVAVTGRRRDPLYALGAAYAALGDTALGRRVVDSVLALPP